MTRRRSPSRQDPLSRLLRPRRSPAVLFRRRRQYGIAFIILLASLAALDRIRPSRSSSPQVAPSDEIARYHNQTFLVTEVVDGDTLHINAPDGTRSHTKIRLWGVDTPEVHGVDVPDYFGPEASAFAHSLADNQSVRLELVPGNARDRYRRVLAYVYLPDGSMLNERLIEEGFAYADPRFAHPFKTKFGRLEKRARQARVGLWKDVTPAKMPPWRLQREGSARQPSG